MSFHYWEPSYLTVTDWKLTIEPRRSSLRIKDVCPERREILVRDAKGMKDRITMLPERALPLLEHQIEVARTQHAIDLADGFGSVYLPFALAVKYPKAATELLGHKDVKTTMIYTHVMNRPGQTLRSPADQ